jgi:hypothetical protein
MLYTINMNDYALVRKTIAPSHDKKGLTHNVRILSCDRDETSQLCFVCELLITKCIRNDRIRAYSALSYGYGYFNSGTTGYRPDDFCRKLNRHALECDMS